MYKEVREIQSEWSDSDIHYDIDIDPPPKIKQNKFLIAKMMKRLGDLEK